MITGLEDIDPTECMTLPALKEQIMHQLQVQKLVFKDYLEIGCQILFEVDKWINIQMTLGLQLIGTIEDF